MRGGRGRWGCWQGHGFTEQNQEEAWGAGGNCSGFVRPEVCTAWTGRALLPGVLS